MQPFPSRFSRRSFVFHAFVLVAVGCLLGACDRHKAADLPESYGHGSSHQKEYDRHEPDSRNGSRHFSDSKGVSPAVANDDATPGASATPDSSDAGRMFPNGH